MIAASLDALARPDLGAERGKMHLTGAIKPEWEATLDELSATSFDFYKRHIVDDPEVFTYFEQASPVSGVGTCAHRFAAGQARGCLCYKEAVHGGPARDSVGVWLDASHVTWCRRTLV